MIFGTKIFKVLLINLHTNLLHLVENGNEGLLDFFIHLLETESVDLVRESQVGPIKGLCLGKGDDILELGVTDIGINEP